MDINFKIDLNTLCKQIIKDSLDKLGLKYQMISTTNVKISQPINKKTVESLSKMLYPYGISIVTDPKDAVVQKIKNLVTDLIRGDQMNLQVNTSSYLSEQLGFSYGYLSNLFSEMTLTTIENFVIMQKIEMAKNLLATGEHTLTEIAYRLNYSSVAHLSNQFRKTTGMTPSSFQRILLKKKEMKYKD
ncbi:helix-turn-helix domain-containing protein [Echinicola sediminis]